MLQIVVELLHLAKSYVNFVDSVQYIYNFRFTCRFYKMILECCIREMYSLLTLLNHSRSLYACFDFTSLLIH